MFFTECWVTQPPFQHSELQNTRWEDVSGEKNMKGGSEQRETTFFFFFFFLKGYNSGMKARPATEKILVFFNIKYRSWWLKKREMEK